MRFIVLTLSFAVLSGCSITAPNLSEPADLEEYSKQVFESYQEPDGLDPNKPLSLSETVALTVLQNFELAQRRVELAISEGEVANKALLNGLSLTGVRAQDTQGNTDDEVYETVARVESFTLGAAYFDAKLQRSDAALKRGLVAQSAQVRAQEAISLYYQLAAHQAMERKVLAMLSDLREAKEANRTVIEQQLGDPLAALGSALELGELEATLLDKLRATIQLRDQFRKLLGRPGASPVVLALQDPNTAVLPDFPDRPEVLTAAMLLGRYEVISTFLEAQQAQDTYYRTLVSWLPSLSVNATDELGADGEDYRGWRVSWNLLNLAKIGIAQDVLELRRRLVALSQDRAILALDQDLQTLSALGRQSRLQYQVRADNAQLSRATFEALSSASQFRSGRLVLLKAQLNLIEAEFNRDMALATHMSDAAQLFYATGLPVVPEDWAERSFDELVSSIRQWETWSWKKGPL